MIKKALFALLTVLCLSGMLASPVLADGIIIPLPPDCREFPCPPPPHPIPIEQLEIKYHHVDVSISDQVATTHVDQVFYNPNDFPIEGTYLFPLPLDAAVSSFVLWVDGQPVEGKVLSAQEARAQYEEIVRSLRDPALLEYAGRGAVQASIFPIPPDGERRIELEYSQVLTAENGLVRYTYPLSTEKYSRAPLEDVAVSVKISAPQPIQAVYSPSHNIAVSREDDRHVNAGYEAKNVLPDADFTLFYSTGESQAFHLLSYRDPADPTDPDGFFLLLLAPNPGDAQVAIPKDIFVVLDRSGSMDGEKFRQAQSALRYILDHLNEGDRFNVVSFSTGLEKYASGLRPASEAADAIRYVDRLSAQGNTDINLALLETAGMADSRRPTYIIFLTDGLPTTGETDSQKIIDNFARSAPRNLRLFAFGVGYDVDTYLLDSLAQARTGSSSYVLPGQDINETVSGFYERVSTPVLTELALDFGAMPVYDLYPQPLPDLFKGSQIVLVGRYRDGGTADLTLTGRVGEDLKTFKFNKQVFAKDTRVAGGELAALPRLWATRKIGYLLNQIRLKGPDPETVDQIVRLSIRYGIVTPYTSYLVTEPSALGAEEQARIANDTYNQMQSAPAAPSSGQAAVEKAAGEGAMGSADAPAQASGEDAARVKIVGSRAFVLTDAQVWTDTTYDPQQDQTIKVAFLSDDYFKLAQSDPSLAAALALGERVIAAANGAFYEVVASDESVAPVDVPTLAPTAQPPAGSTPIAQAGATHTPVAPQPTATPGSGRSPGGCLGGLAPAALFGGAVIWSRSRRRQA